MSRALRRLRLPRPALPRLPARRWPGRRRRDGRQAAGGALRLVVSGGGTAGHVYPAFAALATWEEEAAADPAVPPAEVTWIGSRGGLEEALVTDRGLPYHAVSSGPLRGASPVATGRSLLRLVRGVVEALAVLRRVRPDVVLTTGGYVSVPAALAARLLRRPVVVFLPDVVPGLAVRLQARVARRVAAAFEDARGDLPAGRTVVTGYPVRPALLAADRTAARARWGVEDDLPVLLLYGGSLGARSLNYGIAGALPAILTRCHFIHVCGTRDHAELRTRTAELPAPLADRYHLHDFLGDGLVDAMAAADLAIARAGASTLAELPAVGLPAIVVPGPFSDQEANAAYLEQHGAAVALADEAVRAGALGGLVLDLLDDVAARQAMAAASAALARPDAAALLNATVRGCTRRP